MQLSCLALCLGIFALGYKYVDGKAVAENGLDELPHGTEDDAMGETEELDEFERDVLNMLDLPMRPQALNRNAPLYMENLYLGMSFADAIEPDNSLPRDRTTTRPTENGSNDNTLGQVPTVRGFRRTDKRGHIERHPERLVFDVKNFSTEEMLFHAELVLNRKAITTALEDTPYEVGIFQILDSHGNTHLLPVDRIVTFQHQNDLSTDVFDITPVVRRWIEGRSENHGLLVVVKSSTGRNINSNLQSLYQLSDTVEDEPLLVLYSNFNEVELSPARKEEVKSSGYKNAYKERHKRTAPKAPNDSTDHCHLQTWYLDFEIMGWDKWVLEPKGHFINYCKGECTGPLPTTGTNTSSHAFIRSWYRSSKYPGHEQLPPSHCVATKLSPMSIFYIDENQNYIIRRLPGMIADNCGCV